MSMPTKPCQSPISCGGGGGGGGIWKAIVLTYVSSYVLTLKMYT